MFIEVSGVDIIEDVSGATAEVSVVLEPSLLLLQAAKEAAIIAIAKNFFIFEILGLLTIDLGFIRKNSKSNPRFKNFFSRRRVTIFKTSY
jgi:hypothetical protein